VYSIQWAEDVVKAHYRKHARASYFLLVSLDFTTKLLANWLVRNDPRWDLYKMLIEEAEKRSISDHSDPGVSFWLRAVSKRLTESARDGSNWLLTRIQTSPMLKKRWLEGLPSADSQKRPGDQPGQLFLFPDKEVPCFPNSVKP